MSAGVGTSRNEPSLGSHTTVLNVPAAKLSVLLPEPAMRRTRPSRSTVVCSDRAVIAVGSTVHRPTTDGSSGSGTVVDVVVDPAVVVVASVVVVGSVVV